MAEATTQGSCNTVHRTWYKLTLPLYFDTLRFPTSYRIAARCSIVNSHTAWPWSSPPLLIYLQLSCRITHRRFGEQNSLFPPNGEVWIIQTGERERCCCCCCCCWLTMLMCLFFFVSASVCFFHFNLPLSLCSVTPPLCGNPSYSLSPSFSFSIYFTRVSPFLFVPLLLPTLLLLSHSSLSFSFSHALSLSLSPCVCVCVYVCVSAEEDAGDVAEDAATDARAGPVRRLKMRDGQSNWDQQSRTTAKEFTTPYIKCTH